MPAMLNGWSSVVRREQNCDIWGVTIRSGSVPEFSGLGM